MRIIGGEYRGRKIKSPPFDTVRPTKDRVREAVFSIIAEKVPGSSALDLFSGSGAYGLEALSRGAKECVFIEKDPKCADVLKENITLLRLGNSSEIMTMDVLESMKPLKDGDKKFDIIFSDPPYNYNINKKLLIMIYQYDILKPSGALVVEHSPKEEIPRAEGDISIYKQKTYGDTSISVFLKQ